MCRKCLIFQYMLNTCGHFLYNTDKACESYLKNNSVGDALSSHDTDYISQCSSKQKRCVITYCHVLLRTDWGHIEGLMIVIKIKTNLTYASIFHPSSTKYKYYCYSQLRHRVHLASCPSFLQILEQGKEKCPWRNEICLHVCQTGT